MEVAIKDKVQQIFNIVSTKDISNSNFSLFTGECGLTLFLQQHNHFLKTTSNIDERIEHSFNIIQRTPNLNFSHCSGLAGVVWLYHFFEKNKLFDSERNLIADSYPYLFKSSMRYIEVEDYDFLHGSIGQITWLLDRIDKKEIIKYITHLKKIATRENEYLYWRKIEDNSIKVHLGMAHGIPSIISFLSKSYKEGICCDICEELINGGLKFILKYKIHSLNNSLYPKTVIVEKDFPMINSRLGWCWGDLGIALAFCQAGKALNNNEWKQEAINIMLHASERRRFPENGVIDAGICHGSAGIAHIFNRFYWECKMPIFKETADFWIGVTLKMANHKDGLAGYKTYTGEEKGYWKNELGLLEGISGIGLVLLSHLSEEEPTWDSCFFMS